MIWTIVWIILAIIVLVILLKVLFGLLTPEVQPTIPISNNKTNAWTPNCSAALCIVTSPADRQVGMKLGDKVETVEGYSLANKSGSFLTQYYSTGIEWGMYSNGTEPKDVHIRFLMNGPNTGSWYEGVNNTDMLNITSVKVSQYLLDYHSIDWSKVQPHTVEWISHLQPPQGLWAIHIEAQRTKQTPINTGEGIGLEISGSNFETNFDNVYIYSVDKSQ